MGEIIASIIFGFLMLVVLIVIYIIYKVHKKIYIGVRNTKLHNEAYEDLDTMNRDIDAEYSPAVLSYFYNEKLELRKDVIATLLNLYNKNVIDVQKRDNSYELIPKNNENILNLTEDERYLYDCFITKTKEFESLQWYGTVIKEYEKCEFAKKEQEDKEFDNKGAAILLLKNTVISFLATLLLGENILNAIGIKGERIISKFLFFLIFFSFMWIVYAIIILPIKNIKEKPYMNLTEKGKEEMKKWEKFKNFITNYTLIEKRGLEEVKIYEKYIPYAMVLNINKEYNNEVVGVPSKVMEICERLTRKYIDL